MQDNKIIQFFRKHPAKILIALMFLTAAGASSKYFEISKNLDIYATLFKEVNEYYVEEINSSRFMREGIDAMLESLDPYTSFISESEIEDFRFMTTGQYGGIGASITRRDGKIMITQVYRDFPAHNSGLIPGDRIIQVGDIEVTGKGTSEVSDLLKGQPDSEVRVYIEREGEEDLLEVDIKRQQVQVNNVPFYGMIDDKTAFVKLASFRQGATNEVRSALETLKEDEGIERIVLDLRDNPGGLLSEAVNLTNLFVPRGEMIVSTRGRVEDWENEYRTRQEPFDTEMPLVVLINNSSASASEIVAGAVQDLDRGVVVGQRSYGKGSVQTTRQLSYNTQLKITTAKYYIPSGRSIERLRDKVDDASVIETDPDRPSDFTTRNGRTVRESNGIEPDVSTERQRREDIVRNLRGDHLIFDFATRFHINNEEIPDPDEFEVDDALFSDFVTYVNEKDFLHQSRLAKSFEDFAKQASSDDAYEEIENNVKEIRAALKHDLNKVLNANKDEISKELAGEIASRFYFRSGRIEASFRQDPDVIKAREIVKDMEAYNSILAAAE